MSGSAQHASPLEAAMLHANPAHSNPPDEPPIFNVLRLFPESLPFVLNSETNLNVLSQEGDTPLTLAARLQNISATLALINYAANPYQKDTHGKMPLDYAVESGNRRLISLLLVNMGFTPNSSALARLHKQHFPLAVQYIMSQGHPEFVSAITERGRTYYKYHLRENLAQSLSVAEKEQYETDKSVVKATLVSAGLNALQRFQIHTTGNVVNWALLKNALKKPASRSAILFELRKYFILELLWQGSTDNIPRLFGSLFSSKSHSDKLRQLAMLSFEIYTVFDFHESFAQHQPQPTEPSINDQSTAGYTLLMVAIQAGDRDAINTHLANPALNINLQAKCGLTALFAAIQSEDVETVRAILTTQRGKVNFDLRTAAGHTPFDLAIMMRNPDIMALLVAELGTPHDNQAQAAPADTAPPSQLHTTQPTGDLASLAELDSFFGVIDPPRPYLPTLSAAPETMSNTTSASIRNDSDSGQPAAKKMKLSA